MKIYVPGAKGDADLDAVVILRRGPASGGSGV